jgi:hypothetical protein
MKKELKPEIKAILDKLRGINADEEFVKQEFERLKLKKEMHRYSYDIMYNILGHCHISAHLSTMSSTAEIAVKKYLIRCELLNDENYIEKDENTLL